MGWHWVVVKETTVLTSGCQARRMSCSCSKDLSGKDFQRQYSRWSSQWLSGKDCQRQHSGWGLQLINFFWLADGEVTEWCFRNLNHHPSGSNQSGIYCAGQHVDISTWVRISFSAEQLKDMCVRYTCDYVCPWRGMRTAFMELLFKLSLLFLPDCFPLLSVLSHFPNWWQLESALWGVVKAWETKAFFSTNRNEGQERVCTCDGHAGSCKFHPPFFNMPQSHG